MNKPRPFPILFLALLITALGLWYVVSRQQDRKQRAGPGGTANSEKAEQAQKASADIIDSRSPSSVIAALFARLRDGSMKPGDLAAFRAALLEADPGEAIMAIVKFLATGQDALTGEVFDVGGSGALEGAPTMRVLMLDLLGRICKKSGTGEAAEFSRRILETKSSADEWAIALRNVAWANPSDREYLAAKCRELIRHEPWRAQPSGGYREAFDVIVFTRDVTFITELADMTRGDDKSLQRTAAITLDRLAEMAPLDAMRFLNTNPAELGDKPFLRADYFSKADFTQTSQRVAVEDYLSRPDIEKREKTKMLAVMASPGTFVSDNLLTQPAPADIPPARTNALRTTVADWIQTNRFPDLSPALMQLQARLAE